MTDSAEGPTPETNAEVANNGWVQRDGTRVIRARFARDLERRLVEAQEIGMTLQRNLGTVESEIEQLIDERDSAEETVSQIYFLVIGESPEWSNEFGHEQATEEIVEATTLLRDSVKAERARADALHFEVSVQKAMVHFWKKMDEGHKQEAEAAEARAAAQATRADNMQAGKLLAESERNHAKARAAAMESALEELVDCYEYGTTDPQVRFSAADVAAYTNRKTLALNTARATLAARRQG